MADRRPSRILARAVATMAPAALVAASAPAAGATGDAVPTPVTAVAASSVSPSGDDVDVLVDHGAGPVVVQHVDGPLDLGFEPLGFEPLGLGTPGPGASIAGAAPPGSGDAAAAVDVGGIRPGIDGFAYLAVPGTHLGGYHLQLVQPPLVDQLVSDTDTVRQYLQAAAAHLTAQTSLAFAVDPVVAGCTGCSSDEHWPPSQPQAAGGRLLTGNVGVIRVRVSSTSPCGSLPVLLLPGQRATVGCATTSVVVDGSGTALLGRASVWLAPALTTARQDLLGQVLLHEIGHGLGLDHFTGRWPDPTSPFQLMHPELPVPASDVTGGLNHLHRGDRNGVWRRTNPFGWLAAATYLDFLGRPPDATGYRSWFTALANRQLSYHQFVESVARSNEALRRVVGQLYLSVLRRPADPGGLASWTAALPRIGAAAVAASLFGSSEYLQRNGGTVDGFVRALYRDILFRAADPGGLAVWTAEVGRRGRTAVAFDIIQSQESRELRATVLYCRMLDRPPDTAGRRAWADQLRHLDDVTASIAFALSPEYLTRADDMALRPVTGAGQLLPAPCTAF